MGFQPGALFISYSHHDRDLILTIIDEHDYLSCSAFVDSFSLIPGQDWSEEIDRSISLCDRFILCWSKNAASSDYVKLEWQSAVSYQVEIIPVRFDDEPLPQELKHIQALDFRDMLSMLHGTWKSSFLISLVVVGFALVVVGIGLLILKLIQAGLGLFDFIGILALGTIGLLLSSLIVFTILDQINDLVARLKRNAKIDQVIRRSLQAERGRLLADKRTRYHQGKGDGSPGADEGESTHQE